MDGDQDALLRVHIGRVLAFAGHRPEKVARFERFIRRNIISSMLLMGPGQVISGMALGVDQWAAEAALFLGIPLVAAIPFKGQEKLWPAWQQRHYNDLLDKATKVQVVCLGDYHATKMQARNEWMVDHCGLMLAYWNGSAGGTANCIRYARKKPTYHGFASYHVVDLSESTPLC